MKREPTLDIIKGIAILAIILVHIPKDMRPFSVGITFHVSAFFAVSGTLLFNELEKKNRTDLLQRTKNDVLRLLYPYFTLSALYILIHSFLKLIGIYDAGYSFRSYLFSIFSFISVIVQMKSATWNNL